MDLDFEGVLVPPVLVVAALWDEVLVEDVLAFEEDLVEVEAVFLGAAFVVLALDCADVFARVRDLVGE